MKVHVIVDFNYNYYRQKFSIEAGKLAPLSAVVDGVKVDTTYHYNVLNAIESYRKNWSHDKFGRENEVTMSICVDSKSDRKDESDTYKDNREGKLDNEDFARIQEIVDMLKIAGYNIYKEEGAEADDLVQDLVEKYKDEYDANIIYTNDSDLLVNLCDNVAVMRYKSSLRDHVAITESNMPKVMSQEFKAYIVNNNIILFKVLVGDKSDRIKGVKGFGVKAFDKFMGYLIGKGMTSGEFSELKDWRKVEELLYREEKYFGEDKLLQALNCLNLVKPRERVSTDVRPVREDSMETRREAYSKYLMVSLIK